MFKKKEEKKNQTASAGIAGAIIGAGIAVAATKALSDKKNREQLKKTAFQVKGKLSKVIEDVKKDVKKRSAETKKEAYKKVEEEVKEIKK
jgi:membrane protein implicated in regulation of membrane protease activity